MTSPITIVTPAGLVVLAGNPTLSSLAALAPGGVSIDDPGGGTLSVTIVAGNAAAWLSASGVAGALVSANGNTLTIQGSAAEVNSALASLELTEPVGAGADDLLITASDPLALPAQGGMAVDVISTIGPAMVAPPDLVTIKANSPSALPVLYLSDPIASGLAAMGRGTAETLSVTLALADGVILLPGYKNLGGIAASGLGSGTVVLSLNADELGALNTLLAGLELYATGGSQEFFFSVNDVAGVLPPQVTRGEIYLNLATHAAGTSPLTIGSQILQPGNDTLAGVLQVKGTYSVLGNLNAAGGVEIAPLGALVLPGNNLLLSGTSLDDGQIVADGLVLDGAMIAGAGASLAGEIVLGTAGLLDFAGLLVADGAGEALYNPAISLQSGGVLAGGGTLLAGNFSEPGGIAGPGTILARDNATLLIAAGSIGGGADLAVAPGGVMVLGPVSPLYGIFDATPMSIDSSVTLSFEAGAAAGLITGGYASTLGDAGGAFVISGPQYFNGTVIGFAPGDQLIFPDLSDFNVLNVSANGFEVAGAQSGEGGTVEYTIAAAIPAGDNVVTRLDAAGASDVMLEPPGPVLAQAGNLAASVGTAQPLLGLSLELPAATSQSLSLTIAVSSGVLEAGTLAPAARITLAAANINALNTALAGLSYVAGSSVSGLTFSGGSGALQGFSDVVAVAVANPLEVVNAYSGEGVSEAQSVSFGPVGQPVPQTLPLAAGDVLVSGVAEFASFMEINGLSGTALDIDAGGNAVFDSAAAARFGADLTIGDAGGAGSITVLGGAFSTSGNITLASAAGAAGSVADVLGDVAAAGSLVIGGGDLANMLLAGTVQVASMSLGTGGTLIAYGNAAGSLGAVNDFGSIVLEGDADLQLSALTLEGAVTLGGESSLGIAGGIVMLGGPRLQIGAASTISAASLSLVYGYLGLAGTLQVAGEVLDGIATDLAGGLVTGTSFAADTGLTQGYGVIDAPSITDDGTILATGGALVLQGGVYDDSVLEVAAGATLDITGSFGGAPAVFLGTAGVIIINDPAGLAAGFENMVGSDEIDLLGVAPSLVSFSGGALTIDNSQGGEIALAGLQAAPGQPALSIAADGHGGTLLTLGGEMPCFARGTALLTLHGYRAVEALKPGDALITTSGVPRPLRWIGRRTLDFARDLPDARPVRIQPGAFGPNLPQRPLRLSPSHCIYAAGRLVPASLLVNGATILREPAAAITYYHVELDRHDILLAEGLPCESYFDDGNRAGLYFETGRRSPAPRRYAPVLDRGPALQALRRRLHERALAAGFSLTYQPSLRAIAGGVGLVARIERAGGARLAHFTLPRPLRDITLLAPVSRPTDTDPDSADARELGACLYAARGLEFRSGWLPAAPGDAGRWMGARAVLAWDRPRQVLSLPIAAIPQSWAGAKRSLF